jgi:hypothetical protein
MGLPLLLFFFTLHICAGDAASRIIGGSDVVNGEYPNLNFTVAFYRKNVIPRVFVATKSEEERTNITTCVSCAVPVLADAGERNDIPFFRPSPHVLQGAVARQSINNA